MTNADLVQVTVMQMQHVQILREVSYVLVILATLVMELLAEVCYYYLINEL